MDLWSFEKSHIQTVEEISNNMFTSMLADGMEVEQEQLYNMLFEMSVSDELGWKQVVEHYSCFETVVPMECEAFTESKIADAVIEVYPIAETKSVSHTSFTVVTISTIQNCQGYQE